MSWDNNGMRANLQWQWHNDSNEMLNYLSRMAYGYKNYENDPTYANRIMKEAFDYIRNGQSHNVPVYNAYLQCYQDSTTAFWDLVVSASDQGSSLEGCRTNLDWQWGHNKQSIKEAQYANTYPNYIFKGPMGMYFLMDGQRHNPGVMAGYRAIYRDNPTGLWALVNGYV